MNEVFDSEQINVEYRKDDNIVLVVLKGKVTRDNYRTPMMHAADMAMRHSCKVMAVDFREDPELNEKDILWSKKVLFNNLKKSGLETIALIDNNGLSLVQGIRVFCGDKFRTVVCKDYDEAVSKTKGSSDEAAEKFKDMTREEALKYMGLNENADIKEIDDRFWQMSKKYRGKDDPESLKMEDEISAVYDVASGRREVKAQEDYVRNNEPKYFGRYKSDWQNIIHYNWKSWLLAAVVIISGLAVIISYLSTMKSDCSVLVFGHMYLDNSQMREALEAEGYHNPYVGIADIVVPNDENIGLDQTGNEAFNAQFYTNPDILVSDEKSYPYYFNVFKDMAPIYDQVMAGLSDKAKAGVRPVYMSQREYVRHMNDYYAITGLDNDEMKNPADYPDDQVLIGIEITDRDLITKYGAEAKWKSRQTTFIFGQCVNSTDDAKTVKMMTALINKAFENQT